MRFLHIADILLVAALLDALATKALRACEAAT